uniref:Peptidase S1 domain-containing protein n=1 Tax=Timema bartmani TaxID=61472 RepID=A0A7R9I2N7_9NEOP|nr:unnamed protein product [Timema bartmani]
MIAEQKESLYKEYLSKQSGAWLTPIYLQTFTVQIVTNEYCQNAYNEYDIPVYNVHLCASNGPEFGVCSGDSGGPLVFGGRLVGIVSWGTTTCAIGYPDAYVRVSEFLDWIRQNALD